MEPVTESPENESNGTTANAAMYTVISDVDNKAADDSETAAQVTEDGWKKTVVPAVGDGIGVGENDKLNMHLASYTALGLSANTTYLIKVQTNNQFGNSEVSEVFSFTTSEGEFVFFILFGMTVGRGFVSQPGHTKDHFYKNGTNCIPAWRSGIRVRVSILLLGCLTTLGWLYSSWRVDLTCGR